MSARLAPRQPPGPQGSRLLGSFAALKADPLRFLLETARDYGPVARIHLPRVEARLFSSPAGVKRILQDNNENYGRDTRSFRALRATLGNGLVTSDGDFWRRQRRIAQPAFHKQRLAGFAAIMRESAAALVERWRGLAAPKVRVGGGGLRPPKPVAGGAEPSQGSAVDSLDVVPELARTTLQILGRALFSQDLTGAAETVGEGLGVVLRHTMETVNSVFAVPGAIPTPANRRFKSALRALDGVVLEAIRQRRASGADHGDLLSMLVQARDAETGEGMTDRQLRDEVMTLMLAGHETTTVALSWTLMLLSRHPSVRRGVEAELDEVLAGRPPALEDLPRLRRARMALEESMRLYPPAWVVTRSVRADDEVDGYLVPAGSMVIVSPYVTHRDPSLWPNPEGFDPERFATESARYAYFPFGGGPHLCIGAGFAMMEAQLVLATVMQSLRLDLVPGHPIECEPLVTLRPRHGVRMTLHAR